MGSLKSAGKRQESATFLQRRFFNAALQFSACCSAAFGKNDLRTAEKCMLQSNLCSATFRKTAAQLPFSLVACCRRGVLEGWGLGLAARDQKSFMQENFRLMFRSLTVQQGRKHRGHYPRKVPLIPAEPHRAPQSPAESSKRPMQRPLRTPLRGKFP